MKDIKKRDQKLLNLETALGLTTMVAFFTMFTVSTLAFAEENNNVGIILMTIAILFLIAMAGIMLRMEQLIGYYVCSECHHKYIPKYSSVLWGMHFGRTRYIKCPKCHKYSWQKKSL